MEFIPQMEPWFDEKERDSLYEYMNSGGWVTEFKKTREFENLIAEYTGASYCSVMPNGTISLIAALSACGIAPGDEVIVPDFTMVATPNAASILGAKVIFTDIDRENLCMDFDAMERAVTPNTRAVIFVSINGRFPKYLDRFVAFCKERGIWLIEDAAQSLGSVCNGRQLGLWGDIGSFSFSAPKVISTGQGGALITNNADIFEKIRKIRDFGRECGGIDRYLTMGWNFKFTDIQAVIGIEQMKKLPWRIERKKEIGKIYVSMLSNIAGVTLIPTDLEQTAPWMFDILCDRRSQLMDYLKDNGIGTRIFYPPLHSEPAYHRAESFPVTEEIAAKGLWLPSSSKLTNQQVTYVCECIRRYYC